MGGRPWGGLTGSNLVRNRAGWIRGLRSGLLLSGEPCLTGEGLGVEEGLEGGVANLQDEVSEALRGRPTAAARAPGKMQLFYTILIRQPSPRPPLYVSQSKLFEMQLFNANSPICMICFWNNFVPKTKKIHFLRLIRERYSPQWALLGWQWQQWLFCSGNIFI